MFANRKIIGNRAKDGLERGGENELQELGKSVAGGVIRSAEPR